MAEISLVYRAVFIAILDGSSELGWVGIGLIIFKTWSWSPCGEVFDSSKSKDTVLLGVGNCLISFLKSFAESFDFDTAV